LKQEEQLLARLQQRDEEAIALIFDSQSDRIYRLALSILHDEQQADGVVQDTFIQLIRGIDSFEARASIGTWLYRVAYNECMVRLRKTKPDVKIDEILEEDFMPGSFVSWQDIPDSTLYSQEAWGQMQAAIHSLPSILRTVFTLRDIEELSTRETATVLNISESAVKVRLHRARLLLREKLANYFQEWVRT